VPIQTPLLAVLPALLITAAVFAALWRPWDRSDRPRPAWAGAVALAAAMVVADPCIWRTWSGFWNPEEHRRVWIVAVLGMTAAIVDSIRPGKIRGQWVAAVVGAAMILPVKPAILSTPDLDSVLWLLMYGLAISILWAEVGEASERVRGPQVPMILGIAGAGAALAIVQSASLSMGLLAAAAGAGMGAFALLAFWRRDMGRITAAIPVYMGVIAPLLALSSGMFREGKILVVLSAATPALLGRGPLRKLNPWLGAAACVLLTIGLAAWALKYTSGGYSFGEG
jgi:hypothetical protein